MAGIITALILLALYTIIFIIIPGQYGMYFLLSALVLSIFTMVYGVLTE